MLVRASNLPYKNTPVIEIIKKETGIECVLCNDATCAVYGELYAGLGKEFSNIVMLTLGTGVGGDIIIDKKVYTGKKGGAGEFGHFTINFDGHPCPCGQRGCMEQYTSVTALIRQTKEAIDNKNICFIINFKIKFLHSLIYLFYTKKYQNTNNTNY